MPRPAYLDPVEPPVSGRSCLFIAIGAILLILALLFALVP